SQRIDGRLAQARVDLNRGHSILEVAGRIHAGGAYRKRAGHNRCASNPDPTHSPSRDVGLAADLAREARQLTLGRSQPRDQWSLVEAQSDNELANLSHLLLHGLVL